jgi:hypothetical protein
MAKTMFDAGLMTSAESWRTIRSLRADPPARFEESLGDRDRRRVWHAGLEQAQQQFDAAASVGYDSRPLNLFYGLSQAGRAIAAGSHRLPGRSMWRAQGHSLRFSEGGVRNNGLWGSVSKVEPSGNDLFSTVGLALGHPLDGGRTTIGALASQLPDFQYEFGVVGEEIPALTVHGIYAQAAQLPLPVGLDVTLPGVTLTSATGADEISRVSERYPALDGLEPWIDSDGTILGSQGTGSVTLQVVDREKLVFDGTWFKPVGMRRYRRHSFAFPSLAGLDKELHPLQSWWLVLHALSILARYAPEVWTRLLSISESRDASRVEFLLDSALSAVPELIAEVLYEEG